MHLFRKLKPATMYNAPLQKVKTRHLYNAPLQKVKTPVYEAK